MMAEKNELVELWTRALDPRGVGLPQAVAEDIASYTGETLDTVLAKMRSGVEDFRRLWEDRHVNIQRPESVAGFYAEQFVEAYELANWHAGANGPPPTAYCRAALLAKRRGLRRALDYGSGIGSGALCLAAALPEVHCADIAEQLLKFVGHRLGRHGVTTRLINLHAGERPEIGRYDLITCFDVLEHVPTSRRPGTSWHSSAALPSCPNGRNGDGERKSCMCSGARRSAGCAIGSVRWSTVGKSYGAHLRQML